MTHSPEAFAIAEKYLQEMLEADDTKILNCTQSVMKKSTLLTSRERGF